MLIDSILSWQPYVADIALDKVQKIHGFELTGTPEGIPSLAEYLAEYCSAAVRLMPIV